jgi:hypothetical protein
MASDTIVDWKLGNISSALGKEFKITVGESTSAVLGLAGSLTIGNKLDFLADPSNLWPFSEIPGIRTVSNFLFGRNEYLMGSKNEYVYNMKSSVLLGGKTDMQASDIDSEGLKKWCLAANGVVTAALFYLSFAGKAMSADYASGSALGWKMGNAIIFSVTLLITVVTLSLAYYATIIKAQIDNLKKSIENSKDNEQIAKVTKEIKALKGSIQTASETLIAVAAIIGFITVAAATAGASKS